MVVAYYLLIKFRWEIIILFWWTRLEVADNGVDFVLWELQVVGGL